MSAPTQYPNANDQSGAHSLHRLVRRRSGFYHRCTNCKKVTWNELNAIGMWICEECRRDNSPPNTERSSGANNP
jgi:ribosomal protein L37AE/L43A